MLAKSDEILMILPRGERERAERNAFEVKNGPCLISELSPHIDREWRGHETYNCVDPEVMDQIIGAQVSEWFLVPQVIDPCTYPNSQCVESARPGHLGKPTHTGTVDQDI